MNRTIRYRVELPGQCDQWQDSRPDGEAVKQVKRDGGKIFCCETTIDPNSPTGEKIRFVDSEL